MSKVIKIGIVLFVLIFFVSFSNIYALSMDIPDATTEENQNQDIVAENPENTDTEIDSNANNEDLVDTSEDLSNDEEILQTMDETLTPTVSTNPSTLPEANLGLNNVLNILLIVVGFVLILLGIAIILRLRR